MNCNSISLECQNILNTPQKDFFNNFSDKQLKLPAIQINGRSVASLWSSVVGEIKYPFLHLVYQKEMAILKALESPGILKIRSAVLGLIYHPAFLHMMQILLK